MKKLLFQHFAFTLAEVLITLAIIGIVAALTIPVLVNYAFEQASISSLKKTYSMLAQAVLEWQNDNDCVGNTALCPEYKPEYDNYGEGLARSIAKYIKYDEVYYSPSTSVVSNISWLPDKAYALNGSTTSYDACIDLLPDKNGTYGWLGFFHLPDNVTLMIGGVHHGYNVVIDTNGVKPPNRHGKDIFVANFGTGPLGYPSFNPYGIVNYWGDHNGGNLYGLCTEGSFPAAKKNCNPDDGHSPTAYVLKNGKLPDLKAMGYPTSP